MYRMLFAGLFMFVVVSVSPGMLGAQQSVESDPKGEQLDPKADTQTFLTIAVEEQQVAIALGQLAAQRAENGRVKEFGSRMVEDHKKVRREAEQLASKHRVALPTNSRRRISKKWRRCRNYPAMSSIAPT